MWKCLKNIDNTNVERVKVIKHGDNIIKIQQRTNDTVGNEFLSIVGENSATNIRENL